MSKRRIFSKDNRTPLREAWKRKFFSCGKISDQTGFWLMWGRLNVPEEVRKYRAYVVLSPRRVEFRVHDHVYFVTGQLRRDEHHTVQEQDSVFETTYFDYPKSELLLGLRLTKEPA